MYNPLSLSTKKVSEYCFIHKMELLIIKPYNKCLLSIYLYFVIHNGLFGCTQHRIQYLPYVYIAYVIALNNAPFYIHISLCMIWRVDPLGLYTSNMSWNLCISLNSTSLFFKHQNSTNLPLSTPYIQNDPNSITILVTPYEIWYHNINPHNEPFPYSHVITHFKAYTIIYKELTIPP